MTDFNIFYVLMLLIAICYMPTIGLNNAISYYVLEENKFDIIKCFPPIRVWGTIGFVMATWCIDALQWKIEKEQFYLAATGSFFLGLYAFTLPIVPVSYNKNQTLIERFGLDAFVLFRKKKIAVFLCFQSF